MIRTALLLLLGWTTTAFGQVDVTLTDTVGITYKSSWDGNLLILEAVEGCSGYAEFRIEVSEPVVVTYTASRICGGNPSVDPPFGPFSNIRNDWIVQNTPSTWSGSFTAQPGVYWYWFLGFDGRFCFDCCGGDFNEDETVDFNDLQVLLSNWGSSDAGDANYDGMTDFADLVIVASNWGACSN